MSRATARRSRNASGARRRRRRARRHRVTPAGAPGRSPPGMSGSIPAVAARNRSRRRATSSREDRPISVDQAQPDAPLCGSAEKITAWPAITSVCSMASSRVDETRDGVDLTNLDQPLFDGADATKRDLVDYLDAVRDRILPTLEDRPLSVIRARPGQAPFMQKNVPKYTPEWVRTVEVWAETSKRDVSYALCNDRRTLLWFANQRAVEYHPALVRVDDTEHMTHLVLDLDPPEGDS